MRTYRSPSCTMLEFNEANIFVNKIEIGDEKFVSLIDHLTRVDNLTRKMCKYSDERDNLIVMLKRLIAVASKENIKDDLLEVTIQALSLVESITGPFPDKSERHDVSNDIIDTQDPRYMG